MSGGIEEKKPGGSRLVHDTFSGAAQDTPGPGKRPLTEQLTGEPVQRKAGADGGRDLSFDRYEERSFNRYVDRSFELTSVQRKAASSAPDPGDQVHAAAEHGITGSSSSLPHAGEIQRSFGRHDVSGIKAHTDGAAAAAAAAMGAQAFASGNHVAFAGPPDLYTAAHEAAHVVQQRGGGQLKAGVGEVGDPYEQHADAVADAVVAGRSAAPLLDQHAGGSGGSGSYAAVQRAPAKHTPDAARHEPDLHIASATPGIDKAGFIDNGSGAPLYNRPPEAGGELVRAAPLPPTARVFVSGTYPKLSDWWYVTAYLEQTMVRGYVERVRVAADLPEPLAELRQLTGGETAEGLAKEKYHEAVRDGHDLRYYENVLLYVNQQHHRKGVIGAYQDPGVAGNGSNNVQLVAGHRIWLVSPEYAKALESVVPSGSLTGGAVAKVKRFMGHLEDILKSVTESVHHVDEVAGEYAQAIRDHMASIIGITAAFITAEAISMFAAATPTGVGQAVAVVIQLALAAFGAAGMVEAGLDAMKHGNQWLTTAWMAKGDDAKILEASREFLRMLVTIAAAALSYTGAKGNYRNALKIANSMPTGGLQALAVEGGGASGGARTGAAMKIGLGVGGVGAAGAQMTKHEGEGGGDKEPTPAPKSEKPRSPKEIADDLARRRGNLSERAQAARRGDLKAEVDALRGEIETLQELANEGPAGLERDLAERGQQMDKLSKKITEAEEKVAIKANPKEVTSASPAPNPKTDPARKFLEGHGAATLKRVELPVGCGVSVDGLLEMPLAQLRKLLAMQPDEALRAALGLGKDVNISKTREAITTVVKVVEQAERLMEKL